MDPFLQLLTQPWFIVLVAVGVFVGRVMYLAKRLKSASRSLTLADLRALEEAKTFLDAHERSLEEAKGALAANLGGARDDLRHYKRPLEDAVASRRKDIEASMHRDQRVYEDAKKQPAFKEAKALYKTAVPRKTHREPAKEM